MANGLYAAKKLIRDNKKFKRVKPTRYSVKACNAPVFKALAIGKTSFGARQPSSGVRKIVKIQIMKTGEKSVAYIPGDQGKSFILDNDILHIAGIRGSKGKTKGDIPVTVFKVIKVNGISLRELVLGRQYRKNI